MLVVQKYSKRNTCCFTGHRIFSHKRIERIEKRLHEEIDYLIFQGVTDFISGGAIGFDHIVSSIITSKKRQGADIRLIFALPCLNQDKNGQIVKNSFTDFC